MIFPTQTHTYNFCWLEMSYLLSWTGLTWFRFKEKIRFLCDSILRAQFAQFIPGEMSKWLLVCTTRIQYKVSELGAWDKVILQLKSVLWNGQHKNQDTMQIWHCWHGGFFVILNFEFIEIGSIKSEFRNSKSDVCNKKFELLISNFELWSLKFRVRSSNIKLPIPKL